MSQNHPSLTFEMSAWQASIPPDGSAPSRFQGAASSPRGGLSNPQRLSSSDLFRGPRVQPSCRLHGGPARHPTAFAAETGVLGTSPRMTDVGDQGASIPVSGARNPNDLNALKNNQRHKSSALKPGAQSELSPSRGRALGTGPSRRWGSNRAGPGWPGGRGVLGGGSQKDPRPWPDERETAGVDGAGSSNRPVPGSVGVADGPFRAALILPVRGETSIGMKQALNRRPSVKTVRRSGQV